MKTDWATILFAAAAGLLAWAVIAGGLTAWLMRTFYRRGYASRQWWRNERAITLRAYLLIFLCGLVVAEIIYFLWWLVDIVDFCILVKLIRDWRRDRRESKQPEGEGAQAELQGLRNRGAPGHVYCF